ncbi:4-hydroxy-tetrahydrodipicolinate synthase [Paenibacillus sp. MMS18-CY102]|uniref:4-hydroxy-tetrahydrodipicolinate synthase n=1 Tax=Paenibacillus sp. MMS18-CY102 TaxID=2682849 RepID=UPI00136613E7|nr:4-hydroxy-tetrahydrodipicolinate synthase [Paenibacillus sp. MMS18-CY102]MWC29943.1 4-hydroxy-tetrahydrodipicolinate synthase [Paenibacillus sp. MMS18-CY102]
MLKEQELRGIYVPIVTPFLPSGELDLASYHRHLGGLLHHDIQGLVLNGTTGESPTVAWEEVSHLMQATSLRMQQHQKHIPVVIGTGTNNTASSVKRAAQAGELGADAVLVVVPYYSRPSMEGIIAHYRAVAQTGVPVIAYEIPSRTGVRLDVHTMRTILDIDGVIGLKDSSGGIDLVSALTASKDCKPIMCGEDQYFHAMLCEGASGGMLASANASTDAFVQVYRLAAEGRIHEAQAAFGQLLPLIHLLFQESNPAPLKWLLAQKGIISSDTLRLPMMPISSTLQSEMAALL